MFISNKHTVWVFFTASKWESESQRLGPGLDSYIFRTETCIEAYRVTFHTAKCYIKRLYFSLFLLYSILESSVTQWHIGKLHHTFTRLTRTKRRFFLHGNGSSSCRHQREALTWPNIQCPIKKSASAWKHKVLSDCWSDCRDQTNHETE